MVPCVEEVKQLLGAVLRGVGPGVHAGVTRLQTLLVVGAVLRLRALLSYRVQGVLGGDIHSRGV